MQIFIMRHGEAVAHATSDAQRALTERGRHDAINSACWLKSQLVGVDDTIARVLVSPYVRAQQTLDAVLSVVDAGTVETLNELTPFGNEQRVADYLQVLADQGISSLLIVSHLPLVGYLVVELCPNSQPPMFATSAIVSMTLDGGIAVMGEGYTP